MATMTVPARTGLLPLRRVGSAYQSQDGRWCISYNRAFRTWGICGWTNQLMWDEHVLHAWLKSHGLHRHHTDFATRRQALAALETALAVDPPPAGVETPNHRLARVRYLAAGLYETPAGHWEIYRLSDGWRVFPKSSRAHEWAKNLGGWQFRYARDTLVEAQRMLGDSTLKLGWPAKYHPWPGPY